MKIHRPNDETIAIEELDSFSSRLLRLIPESANPQDNEAVEARLFPRPTAGREPEADAEWKEYVEPELRELFSDAVEVVSDDLKQIPAGDGAGHSLDVPVKNLEAWIHALNQARLALAARNGFSEKELEHEVPPGGGPRAFALFQIHFYGLLQEFFLRQLE